MKIRSVKANNHKRAFEVATWRDRLLFPFSRALPEPSTDDPVESTRVDEEIGREGFTYRLASGREGTVHIDQVLEYNRDPAYMRDLLLYKLTLEAQRQLERTRLSKREIIRRLGTSAAQFYRLIDTANSRKSVDKLLSLLQVLDCEVELVVREKCPTEYGEREKS